MQPLELDFNANYSREHGDGIKIPRGGIFIGLTGGWGLWGVGAYAHVYKIIVKGCRRPNS